MARDAGLEELMRDHLGPRPGLSEQSMFGGRAWLMEGHLLCAARDDRVLVRLGRGREDWALALDGIEPMRNGGRAMSGWVWVTPERFGDDALARRLLAAALEFVATLPPK